MYLSPKSSPESSLESSLKSPPPEMNPAKRPNDTSSPTDPNPSSPPTDPNPKKSRPNSPDQESSLAKIGLTIADELTIRERARKSWDHFFKNEKCKPLQKPPLPKFNPSEPLPAGWAWGSYDPDDGRKLFGYKMFCYKCGQSGSHRNEDCQNVFTDEAREFRREVDLQFDFEIKQDAEMKLEAERKQEDERKHD